MTVHFIGAGPGAPDLPPRAASAGPGAGAYRSYPGGRNSFSGRLVRDPGPSSRPLSRDPGTHQDRHRGQSPGARRAEEGEEEARDGQRVPPRSGDEADRWQGQPGVSRRAARSQARRDADVVRTPAVSAHQSPRAAHEHAKPRLRTGSPAKNRFEQNGVRPQSGPQLVNAPTPRSASW